MKTNSPELAQLRAYIKTRPSGRPARAALLAYALRRGVPYLAVEPTPLRMAGGGLGAPWASERRSFPAPFRFHSHAQQLADSIVYLAQSEGGFSLTMEEVLNWMSEPPSATIAARDEERASAMRLRFYARKRHSEEVRRRRMAEALGAEVR